MDIKEFGGYFGNFAHTWGSKTKFSFKKWIQFKISTSLWNSQWTFL